MKTGKLEPQTLSWNDVGDATEAFSVWSAGNESEWAELAWEHLYEAGLTTYTTQWERARVAVRFLTLARLYRDWCFVAFNENTEDELTEWASYLDLSPFRLGQIIGEHPDFALRVPVEQSYGVVEDDPTEQALQWLTAQARAEVASALIKQAGSPSALFLSLWRSVHDAPEPPSPPLVKTPKPLPPPSETLSLFPNEEGDEGTEGDDEDEYEYEYQEGEQAETDYEVLNNVTPEKMEGFEWIEDGCPSVR